MFQVADVCIIMHAVRTLMKDVDNLVIDKGTLRQRLKSAKVVCVVGWRTDQRFLVTYCPREMVLC